MRRDGYIVVPSTHRLFPDKVARSIEARAQAVITAVEHRQALTLTPLAFDIHQQPKAGRSSARYVRALFEGNENGRIRILVSDEPMTGATLEAPFKNVSLLVTIEDIGDAPSRLTRGLVGSSSGNIKVSSARLERAVEDVIIDIALGTYFRERSPIKDIIDEGGLAALFRFKAKFSRKWRARGWLSQVEQNATYAMLSSLNQIADDDIAGRAASAYDAWLEFTTSLTAARLTHAHTVAVDTQGIQSGDNFAEQVGLSLAQLPKIGGQLPIRRIITATSKLPAGEHSLIVLLKSATARKSPKLRGHLRALFSRRARRNSFRILSNERLLAARDSIAKLSRSGHLMVVKLEVGSVVGLKE